MGPPVELPVLSAEADILREQLDYLIDHAHKNPQCGCYQCCRYAAVRSILLYPFRSDVAVGTAVAR